MSSYEKQEWVDGSKGTPLSAKRLNHMEEGIAAKSVRGAKGDPGFPTKDDWDALVARVEALESSPESS